MRFTILSLAGLASFFGGMFELTQYGHRHEVCSVQTDIAMDGRFALYRTCKSAFTYDQHFLGYIDGER